MNRSRQVKVQERHSRQGEQSAKVQSEAGGGDRGVGEERWARVRLAES